MKWHQIRKVWLKMYNGVDWLAWSWGSQSVVLRPARSASPGNLLEKQFSGTTIDLLNQMLWGCEPAMGVLTNTPGDSDTAQFEKHWLRENLRGSCLYFKIIERFFKSKTFICLCFNVQNSFSEWSSWGGRFWPNPTSNWIKLSGNKTDST